MTPRTKTLYAFVGDPALSKCPTPADQAPGQGLAAINSAVAAAAATTTAPAESTFSDDTHLPAKLHDSKTALKQQWSAEAVFPRSETRARGQSAAMGEIIGAVAADESGFRALGEDGEDLAAVAAVLHSLDPAKSAIPHEVRTL